MKILDQIDSLSKIVIDDNNEDAILSFMYEFASKVTDFLSIERINIWLLNKERDVIFSIAEYDKRTDAFSHHSVVYQKDVPTYFQHLMENKIILAPNIHTHPATFEFSNNYAKEYDVISLMDIPLRLNGKLIGVMCFEKTGMIPREFNEMEQIFAMALAQLVVAYIENNKRKQIQEKLQNALKEKELLIKELNHRVKNNFSVLVSLLRLSKENLQKEKEKILEEFECQVFSILKVHELLMESEKGTTINVSEYLQKLADEFLASYVDIKDKLQFDIPNVYFEISSKQAVHLGLVVTEIFLNSLKYALLPLGKRFELNLKPLNDKEIEIIVGDDGNAFDFDAVLEKTNSFGLSIIKDMADSSSFDIIYPSKGDSKYKIFISKQ